MFKIIQRQTKLVTVLRLTPTFEVKRGNISHFKNLKREYHLFNVNPRCTYHLPSSNERNKYSAGQTYKTIKSPWLSAAIIANFSQLPDAPIAPQVEEIIETVATVGEPTFKSLGLGGWSPIGLIQHAFEYLHISYDIPWWGCIVIGTIIVRLTVFPLVILAQRNNALMNNHMPQIQHLQLKMTEARMSGNAFDTARYSQELMVFMKQKGLNPLKNALPILLQAPFFISFFVGLRRMANCPVESMKEGGLYWFADLTVPDPLYILPLLTSFTLWVTIEIGADQIKTSNQTGVFIKYALRAIPLVMIPFSINFPGAILCYWLSTNVISLGQVGLLRIPAVREYFKIPAVIKHDPTSMPIKKKGAVQSAKETWSNLKISKELEDRHRTDEMIFNKAGRGPLIKTYKFDPTKHLTDVKAKNKNS